MEMPVKSRKAREKSTREASSQALDYAKMVLADRHRDELWDLGERLENAMKQITKDFLENKK